MCGIFGAVEWQRPLDVDKVMRGTDSLRHRGPDESGFLFDHVRSVPVGGRNCRFLGEQAAGVCQLSFGHRRLSILDVTTGQQTIRPNPRDLRAETKGVRFEESASAMR